MNLDLLLAAHSSTSSDSAFPSQGCRTEIQWPVDREWNRPAIDTTTITRPITATMLAGQSIRTTDCWNPSDSVARHVALTRGDHVRECSATKVEPVQPNSVRDGNSCPEHRAVGDRTTKAKAYTHRPTTTPRTAIGRRTVRRLADGFEGALGNECQAPSGYV